jgi:hypothetical protein
MLHSCQKHSFDVAVIGQAVSPNVKRHLFSVIKEQCPGVKILELYPQFSARILPDADLALPVPVEAPHDLLDRVNELAKQNKAARAKKR